MFLLIWTFVSHVSVGVLLCNDNVQSYYLFPKPVAAFSSWNSSRLDLLIPVGSQHQHTLLFYFNDCTIHRSKNLTPCIVPARHIYSSTYHGGKALALSSQAVNTTRIYKEMNKIPFYFSIVETDITGVYLPTFFEQIFSVVQLSTYCFTSLYSLQVKSGQNLNSCHTHFLPSSLQLIIH